MIKCLYKPNVAIFLSKISADFVPMQCTANNYTVGINCSQSEIQAGAVKHETVNVEEEF